MNNKTNTWAAQVGSREASEAIQRIAFSFGYNWADQTTSTQRVQLFDITVLFFHPEDKTITYGTSVSHAYLYACKVCRTIDDVINAFNNPPVIKQKKTVGDTDIYHDGSVYFGHKDQNAKEFDEVVKARNEFLGREVQKNKMVPKVRFLYNGPSSGQKIRTVLILEDSGDRYSCLDVDDDTTTPFKYFRKDRIVGAIEFLGLKEVKS